MKTLKEIETEYYESVEKIANDYITSSMLIIKQNNTITKRLNRLIKKIKRFIKKIILKTIR